MNPRAFGGRAYRFITGIQVMAARRARARRVGLVHVLLCDLIDPGCGAALSSADDPLSLRFFEPKRRFGVDPRFPVTRYVTGLSRPRVPDRHGEHPGGAFDYVGDANCRNPLFAETLPGAADEELCRRARGPRRQEHVLFALVGGVPPDLLRVDPDDRRAPSKEIGDGWNALGGRAPGRYDFTGTDPRMREVMETETLRASCDVPGGAEPLPDEGGGAYPPLQQLAVVRGLGDRGIVGSICPSLVDAPAPAPPPTLAPTTDAILARAARVLRGEP